MDVSGLFLISNAGNRYILVVMDDFSKWPEVYASLSQEVNTIVNVFLGNWVCSCQVPSTVEISSLLYLKKRVKHTKLTRLEPSASHTV